MLRNVSAPLLFRAGVLTLPAFLLQPDLAVRFAQVLVFGVLTVIAGKRLLWGYFLTIIGAITVFHLLVPTGAVLFEVAAFPVTLGALRTGLFKALAIVGMVFLSLISVRADLKIPGRVGSVIGKLFWSFEQIMEGRERVSISAPFRSTDAMLLELYEQLIAMDSTVADTAERKSTALRSTPAGIGAVTAVVAAQWFVLLVPIH
jgi:heptaprenyl diphosphate synthase